MGKKKKKQTAIKVSKPRQDSISFSERIEKILNIRWIPVLIFLLLSAVYFNEQIFKPEVFVSTESGPITGKGGGSLSDFKNPFKETKLWHMYLGGQPAEQGLMEYTSSMFTNVFMMFLENYEALTLWVIILTFCSGLFMFLYMKTLVLRRSIALIIGTAYMFAPIFLSLLYTYHISKMGVLAIMPLMFLNIEKGMRKGQFRYFLYLGGCFALAIGTAHLQFAYFAMMGSGLYFIFKLIICLRDKEKINLILKKVFLFGFAVVLGLGLCARCILPQYTHTSKHSKRAYTVVDGKKVEGTGFEKSSSWGMHQEEIFSYLIPEFVNYNAIGTSFYWGKNFFKINSEYFGSIILLLSIISLIFLKRDKNILFFLLLFIFSVLFSLGSHTPVYKICYYIIPGMKSLRGPSMMAILTYFSAMVMAGLAIKYLIDRRNIDEKAYKLSYIILCSAGLISLLFIVFPHEILSIWKGVFYSDISQQKLDIMNSNVQNISKGALILLVNILVVIGGLYLFQKKRIGEAVFALILIPMIIIDTWRIDKDFVNTMPVRNVPTTEQRKRDVYEFIKQHDETVFRIFPEHAVQQSQSIFNRFRYEGLYMVTGFLDFTLWRYDNFLRNLSNNGLNLLNTKYIVSGRDIKQDNLENIYTKGNAKVYLNKDALPFYYARNKWIVEKDENRILTMINSGIVDLNSTAIIEKEPPSGYQSANSKDSTEIVFLNEEEFYNPRLEEYNFKINSSAPGFFVLSDNYHPEWHCYINGEEVEVYRANYIWKGVFFPAGEHQISFRYLPKIIFITRKIMFSFIGLFFVMFLIVAEKDYKFFSRFVSKVKK